MNFAVDRAFIWRTKERKKTTKKSRELSAKRKLAKRAHVSKTRLRNKKKKKNHYIIYKDPFNILPIVRGVLSENTREYVGVHKRTFLFFLATRINITIYLYVSVHTRRTKEREWKWEKKNEWVDVKELNRQIWEARQLGWYNQVARAMIFLQSILFSFSYFDFCM